MIDTANPQRYEASILDESSVEEALEERPDVFFNRKDPNLRLLHEKPEHRIAIMLKAQGKSNNEIADLTGYSVAWVSQIMRQPWAQERILQILKEAGSDVIGSLLASTAEDSIFQIVKLRDTSEDDAVKLRASQDLLDRYLGKPTQRVESNAQVTHFNGDVEKLEKDLADTEREINRLQGKSTFAV